MVTSQRTVRAVAATLALSASAACAGAGNIGEVLGSVLGGQGGQGQGNQVRGVVLGVDQSRQQLGIQLQDGQQVALLYDRQTQVVYQNQRYEVTNLERGDRITARVQQTRNGGYYTDLVQVDQSATTSGAGGSSGSGNVQSIQGTVRQVDFQNGLFSLDASGYGAIIVALPYNVSRADQSTFQQLRQGSRVRLYGVFLNDQRVELRQFY